MTRSRLLLALALLVPFLLLLVGLESRWEPMLSLDRTVETRMDSLALASPVWVDLLRVVTTVGGPLVLGLALGVVAVVLLLRRRPLAAGLLVATWIGSVALNRVAKELVGRERPDLVLPELEAAGLSFPSGHAQGVVVAAVLAVVLLRGLSGLPTGPLAAAAGVAVLAVCLSRLGLGVHYLSDVTAGASLGAAWVSLLVGPLQRTLGPDPARRRTDEHAR